MGDDRQRDTASRSRHSAHALTDVLLVDTNVWLAVSDRRSRHHRACHALVDRHRAVLASTVPVIAETGWLLLDRGGAAAQRRFLGAVAAGDIAALDLDQSDWRRVYELVSVYADAALDVVDASTIAIAERLNQTVVATLDDRDFRLVRPRHVAAFELLPDRR